MTTTLHRSATVMLLNDVRFASASKKSLQPTQRRTAAAMHFPEPTPAPTRVQSEACRPKKE
jgi:hypothetical protein